MVSPAAPGALSRGAARVMGSRFAKPVARVTLVAMGLVLLAVIGRASAAGSFGGLRRRDHPASQTRRIGALVPADASADPGFVALTPAAPPAAASPSPPTPHASAGAVSAGRPGHPQHRRRRRSAAPPGHRTEARRRHPRAESAPRTVSRHRRPAQGQRHRPRDPQATETPRPPRRPRRRPPPTPARHRRRARLAQRDPRWARGEPPSRGAARAEEGSDETSLS